MPLGDEPDAGSGPPNILRTVGHHPTLLEPFLAFASALALKGELPRRAHEILALRASWNCRSAFEWGHHVEFAEAAGMSASEIADIAQGAGAEGWCAEERALIRAADELHEHQEIEEATWEALRRSWSDAQLIELVFVVGQYTMLSMVATATGVPLEAHLPGLPEE
jgi:4-carboxymuconolactone decarboxylase